MHSNGKQVLILQNVHLVSILVNKQDLRGFAWVENKSFRVILVNTLLRMAWSNSVCFKCIVDAGLFPEPISNPSSIIPINDPNDNPNK